MSKVKLEGIEIEIIKKKVKNINLTVLPPDGKVRISAPMRASEERILEFVRTKMDWIRKHQEKIQKRAERPEAKSLEYVTGDIVFLWGKEYILEVHSGYRNQVRYDNEKIKLTVEQDSTAESRERILNEWYRGKLKKEIPPLVEKWKRTIGVFPEDWGVKNMKTRWGTCNIRDKRIWLNLQLAKKPSECLEYVVVHELVHLLEKNHNAVFYGHMDFFLPEWKGIRNQLNGENRE